MDRKPRQRQARTSRPPRAESAVAAHADGFQRLLACIAEPSRYRVLMALAEGDRCVTEVAAAVGLSQSCTTRHLQTLQRAGVLERVREGSACCSTSTPAIPSAPRCSNG
jgi:predicted transcriptional regulator